MSPKSQFLLEIALRLYANDVGRTGSGGLARRTL